MQKPAATPAELTLRQGDQFSAVPAPSWDFGGDCVNGVQTVVLLPEKGQTTDKVVFTINRDRKVTDDEAPLTSPSSDKASG
jgi:hypothetical protein